MTCQHENRTLLGTYERNYSNSVYQQDFVQVKTWQCDDCEEVWEERQDVSDPLYTCNGDCADCHEWKEESTCNSTSA